MTSNNQEQSTIYIGVIVPYEMDKGEIAKKNKPQAESGYYRVMLIYPNTTDIVTAIPLSIGQGHANNYSNYAYSSYKVGDKVYLVQISKQVYLILGSAANLKDVEIAENITTLHNSFYGNEISIVEPKFDNGKYASGLIYATNNIIDSNGSIIMPYKNLTKKEVNVSELLSQTIHPIISFVGNYTFDPKQIITAFKNFVSNIDKKNKNDTSFTIHVPDNTIYAGSMHFKALFAPEVRNLTSNLNSIYHNDLFSKQLKNNSETIPYIAASFASQNYNREYIDLYSNAYDSKHYIYHFNATKTGNLSTLFLIKDNKYDALVSSEFLTSLKVFETINRFTDNENAYRIQKINTININPNLNINTNFHEIKLIDKFSTSNLKIRKHYSYFSPYNNKSNGIKEKDLTINTNSISETIAYWLYNINNTLGRNGYGLMFSVNAESNNSNFSIQLGSINAQENSAPNLNSNITISANTTNGQSPELIINVGQTQIIINSGLITINGANVVIQENLNVQNNVLINQNLQTNNALVNQVAQTQNLNVANGTFQVGSGGGTLSGELNANIINASNINATSVQASSVAGGLNNTSVGPATVNQQNVGNAPSVNIPQTTSPTSANQVSGNNTTQQPTQQTETGNYKKLVKQHAKAYKPAVTDAINNELQNLFNFLNNLLNELGQAENFIYSIICNLLNLIMALLMGALGLLLAMLDNALAFLINKVEQILNNIISMINNLINAAKQLIQKVMAFIGKELSSLFSALSKLEMLVSSVIAKIMNIIVSLISLFENIFNIALDFANMLMQLLAKLLGLLHFPSCFASNPLALSTIAIDTTTSTTYLPILPPTSPYTIIPNPSYSSMSISSLSTSFTTIIPINPSISNTILPNSLTLSISNSTALNTSLSLLNSNSIYPLNTEIPIAIKSNIPYSSINSLSNLFTSSTNDAQTLLQKAVESFAQIQPNIVNALGLQNDPDIQNDANNLNDYIASASANFNTIIQNMNNLGKYIDKCRI